MAGIFGPNGMSRRSFVKYATIGGLATVGAVSGLLYPEGWRRWMTWGRKPWEVDLGVVDYDQVLEQAWGPSELGFANEIRNSPPEQRILNVAQWYDYWPGNVVDGFGSWMAEHWGVSGVEVRWQSNIYTSNEELFTWVTQTGRKFDVMFPTNYTVETMEKAGILVNLNRDWLPNYVNLFGLVPSTFPSGPTVKPQRPRFDERTDFAYEPTYPVFDVGGVPYNNQKGIDFRDWRINGYSYRMNTDTYANPRGSDFFTWDEQNSLIAVPYQWGTTGIGYRTDVFRREDIERMGWEVFELSTYTNPDRIDPDTGQPMVFILHKKKMLLDDMREVFTAAMKAVGWKKQVQLQGQMIRDEFGVDHVVTADPTAVPKNTGPTSPPGSYPDTYAKNPFNGDYQWSSNEIADEKLGASLGWLNSFRGTSWGFNTPQQGPWLVSGQMYLDQAWSGDIMYAVQPNSSSFNPVEYFVPKQGGARWIDNSVIHRECEKLWLAHELMNYIHDPKVQAAISTWNLYATPNAWTFEILYHDPAYIYEGIYPDGITPYVYNMARDHRIYSEMAIGYTGAPILERCEYQKDVGVRNTLNYFRYWRKAKF